MESEELEVLYERLLTSAYPEHFDDDKASQTDVSKEIHKWYERNAETWEEIVGRALGHSTTDGKEVWSLGYFLTPFLYLRGAYQLQSISDFHRTSTHHTA